MRDKEGPVDPRGFFPPLPLPLRFMILLVTTFFFLLVVASCAWLHFKVASSTASATTREPNLIGLVRCFFARCLFPSVLLLSFRSMVLVVAGKVASANANQRGETGDLPSLVIASWLLRQQKANKWSAKRSSQQGASKKKLCLLLSKKAVLFKYHVTNFFCPRSFLS